MISYTQRAPGRISDFRERKAAKATQGSTVNSLSPHLLISSWYLNWYNPIRSQREGEPDDTVGNGQPLRTHTGWRRIESGSRNVTGIYLAL